MHFKRALIASIAVYFATFIIGMIAAYVFNIELSADAAAVPAVMWYVSAVSAIALMLVGSFWYFKSPRVRISALTGLQFGIIAVLTGFVLDIVMLLVSGVPENLVESLLGYYMQPVFLITFALIIIVPTALGAWWGRKA